MKQILSILFAIFTTITLQAQVVVIDPGHGYGATTSDNPDGRTATEIETSLDVGLRTRTLIQNSCSAWTVQMTRTTNLNSWISVNQRATMANNWGADRLLSIHCNAGGGTGTETFYCTYDDTTTAPDIAFAQKIQNDMSTNGSWNNRRCVEDNSFLAYHLGVLRYSSATGCLNEIGFVDSSDATKLTSSTWRATFANSYFNSLKSNLGATCSTALPGAFTLTLTPECSGTTSQMRLNWTASSGATSYEIYRNGSLYASDITGTQFLNTYLITPGTSYSYYVKAKNTAGTTNNSNGTKTGTAVACVPGAFTVTTTATCSGSTSAINVTWTASANATSYDIYRNGNLYAQDVTGTSFLNTYLITAGTTYTYYMVAKNSAGTTNNSNGTRSVTAISCTAKISENNGNFITTGEPSFKVYPNPTSGLVSVNLTNINSAKAVFSVYDITGKQVYSSESSIKEKDLVTEVNLEKLPSGIYVLLVQLDNKEYSQKIVKQ